MQISRAACAYRLGHCRLRDILCLVEQGATKPWCDAAASNDDDGIAHSICTTCTTTTSSATDCCNCLVVVISDTIITIVSPNQISLSLSSLFPSLEAHVLSSVLEACGNESTCSDDGSAAAIRMLAGADKVRDLCILLFV
jgi:hypothetical protein